MLKIFWTSLQSLFTAKVRFLAQTYINQSYHIEIEPKRPTAETSRVGTPPKFIQAKKSRPKRPKFSVICTATMLKLFGLVYCPILRLKGVFFWREFTETSEAVHTPLKCKHNRYASKQDTIGYHENVLHI